MHYTPAPRDPKATPVRINLLSDTQTRPTPAMREAMARAEVGDEQIGDDPTVNLLCERVADLLGKEAAVFMPSGTMCNVAATLAYCRPGDEILAQATAHIIAREGGAHAALGGTLGDYGLRLPFVAAAALNFCNLLLAFFILPAGFLFDQPRSRLCGVTAELVGVVQVCPDSRLASLG